MKKLFILMLALMLTLSAAAGCSRRDDKKEPQDNVKDPAISDGKNEMEQAGDDLKDDAQNAADGAARGVRGLWDGMLDFFGMDMAPNVQEDMGENFKAYGIDEDALDDYILQSPYGEGSRDEFFIAKVKEGRMAEVEEQLEKRAEALRANWAESSPEGMDAEIEPRIIKNGSYIMLAVHGGDEAELRAEFERLVKQMEEK